MNKLTLAIAAAAAALAVSAPAKAGYYGYYGYPPVIAAPVVAPVALVGPSRIVCNAFRCWRVPVYPAPVVAWPHRHRHWDHYRGW